MSIDNKENQTGKPMLFNDSKPFGLKFLESPEQGGVPPMNKASVRFGATHTYRPNGGDTHADAFSD